MDFNAIPSSSPVTDAPAELPLGRQWFALIRPEQWVKNLFVLAPLLFAGKLFDVSAILPAVQTFLAFCAAASSVYIVNDIIDCESDRNHPLKRRRPIAAGVIQPRSAMVAAAVLATAGLLLAGAVGTGPVALLALYLVLNALYSFRLKHVVLLDVFSIAAFFCIRLLIGAAAIEVEASVWLLLCGGLLALYLGFAKRRHELVILGEGSTSHRMVLDHYGTQFLDQMSSVLLAVTIVSYIMYTMSPERVEAVGSHALSYSTVFVLFGAFRYLYLVHQESRGSPTETLLADRTLLVTVVLWAAYCGWVIQNPL